MRVIRWLRMATRNGTTRISVKVAMMVGLIPCLTDPKMAAGKVSLPAPLKKLVMMKAGSQPEMTPGIISGKRISRKAAARVVQRSRAACSQVYSIPSSRAASGRSAKRRPKVLWASRMVRSSVVSPMVEKKISVETAMTISGPSGAG